MSGAVASRPKGKTSMTAADQALLARANAGDAAAEQALLLRFEPLLRARAAHSTVPERLMPRDDLLQEFRLAFVRSVRGWDPNGRANFTTYLTHSLFHLECRLLRWTKPGGMTKTQGEPPRIVSLDVTVVGPSGEETDRLAEFLPDPSAEQPFRYALERLWAQDAIRELDPVLGEAVADLYGLGGRVPKSLEEVGARLDLTRTGMTKRLKRAIRMVRYRVCRVEGIPSLAGPIDLGLKNSGRL